MSEVEQDGSPIGAFGDDKGAQIIEPEHIYTIRGKKYWIPEFTYDQYEALGKLVAKMRLPLLPSPESSPASGGRGHESDRNEIRAFMLVKALLKSKAVPVFLSLVLAPEGEEWEPMSRRQAKKVYGRAGDKTIVQVATDFFTERKELLLELMRSFTSSLRLITIMMQGLAKSAGASAGPSPTGPSDPIQTSTTGESSGSGQQKEDQAI